MTMKHMLIRLCVAQVLLIASGSSSAIDPQPTNTTAFDIPFILDQQAGRVPAGYALLFSSVNGGRLEQTQRVPASAGVFHFVAPADGLYAFAVRMTDEAGQIIGETGAVVPELAILVDTVPPELKIQLTETAPGTVEVHWNTNDASVAPGSLRLEYAEGTDGRWHPIEHLSEASGKAVIRIQPGTAAAVRGYITDLAGNQGSGTAELVLSADRSIPAVPQRQSHLEIPGQQIVHETGTPQRAVTGQAAMPLGTIPFPQSYPASPQIRSAAPANSGGFVIPSSQAAAAPAAEVMPSVPAQNAVLSNAQVPRNDTLIVRRADTETPTTVPHQAATTQQGHTLVNNPVFNIAYAVDEVGPSGVGSVDLYVTENNGQQWFRYGSDADKQTPFQVDTRGEGTFGFAVRVRNGLGFSDPPPQAGDLPDITVVVDQTPPVLHMSAPEVVFNDGGRIRMAWQVSDTQSEAVAVRLERAINAAGPWTAVFNWQADTGVYDFDIKPGTPLSLYFRLQGRDAAGNVATVQMDRPVLVDQVRPTARLLQVEPVSEVNGY